MSMVLLQTLLLLIHILLQCDQECLCEAVHIHSPLRRLGSGEQMLGCAVTRGLGACMASGSIDLAIWCHQDSENVAATSVSLQMKTTRLACSEVGSSYAINKQRITNQYCNYT